MAKDVLAVDIGGSKIAYAIVDENGKVKECDRIHIERWEAFEILRQVKFLIKSYSPKVQAAGIAFPGIVNVESGEIVYDEKSQKYVLNWDMEIPIAIDNDANLAAVGEKWVGSAQEVNNFVFIVLGDGIGSGIYLEGHLYRGSHYASGEIKEIITSSSTLNNISGSNFPGEFSENDRSSLSYICDQLAQGIQSIAAIVDPTMIVIGGTRGIKVWPLIERELRERVKHLNILIQYSSLEADASLYGAAKIAFEKVEALSPATK